MSNESMISKKLKISKLLAWIALLVYLISLLFRYGTFNVHGGAIFTGIILQLFVLLVFIIPLLLLFYFKNSKTLNTIAFVFIGILGIGGTWLLNEYIYYSSQRPVKIEIGIYLYFLMVILFFIAMILKLNAPEEINTSIIDDVWKGG